MDKLSKSPLTAESIVNSMHEEMRLVCCSAAPVLEPGFALITAGRIPDRRTIDHPFHSVNFLLRGKSTVECRLGSRSFDYVASPGVFSLFPGWQQTSASVSSPVEFLALLLTPHRVQEIAEREYGPLSTELEMIPSWARSDSDIVGLGQSFASFLRSPHRHSTLYSETLWLQIVLKLLWGYSSLPKRREVAVERLSDYRVQQVIDFMQSTLSEDVSLSDLAKVAGLSPNYFLGAFRRATGKTPHRYRTELRVARAKELLSNPHTPIAQVAMFLGYSSQSHLTTVFRRFTGATPAAYRSQILNSKSIRRTE